MSFEQAERLIAAQYQLDQDVVFQGERSHEVAKASNAISLAVFCALVLLVCLTIARLLKR